MIRLALIGHPVSHSRSPAMMRAALDAMGLDGVYVAFDVAHERLGEAVAGLLALGFDGANVTLPYKTAVMEHLARTDPASQLIGAVNTLTRSLDGFTGHNTDADGLVVTLRMHGADPRDQDVVVLGGGGAARAAAVGVARGGARSVSVLARQMNAALAVTDAVLRAAPRCRVYAHALATPGASESLSRASVVLQATSCGMTGGPPVDELLAGADLTRCKHAIAAMDLVYTPALTPWMRAAERAGLRVLAGAGADILARQGALALGLWTGREAPFDVMREALEL